MPGIEEYIDKTTPGLCIYKGKAVLPVRYISVEGDNFLVKRVEAVKDGEIVTGYAQAPFGLARIEFKSIVRRTGALAAQGIDVLAVTEFRRVQMRNYSRANLTKPIVFHPSSLAGAPHFSGEICNISAGGVGILTSKTVPAGAIYLLEFTIPWNPPIPIRQYAKIIRQMPSPDVQGLLYTACEFFMIDKTDRKALRDFENLQKTLTVFVNQYNIRQSRIFRKKQEEEGGE